MNGIDLLLILVVIALVAAIVRQRAIVRHDREREASRRAVLNILRAKGQIR